MKIANSIISLLSLHPSGASSLRGPKEKIDQLKEEERIIDEKRRLNADAVIFNTYDDGFAQAANGYTDSPKIGTACSTSSYVSFIADPDGDYINVATTKWHSGGPRLECYDKGSHTNWQCAAKCPQWRPNMMNWEYLTFEARVTNRGSLDAACKPTLGLKKGWPSYSSNVLTLEEGYVDGGLLSETEWRRVVIPISE